MHTPFAHVVFFRLKDRSQSSRIDFTKQCHQYLTGHPGTLYFSAAIQSDNDRPVNDRDFDVALHLIFENRQAHDDYQIAERHDQFIQENSEKWESVRVFDSLVAAQEFGQSQ